VDDALLPAGRGDADDPSALALEHAADGEHLLGHPEDAAQVGLDDVAPELVDDLRCVPTAGSAGIARQDVDRAEPVDGSPHEFLDLLR
jgi:hypothetical protein